LNVASPTRFELVLPT